MSPSASRHSAAARACTASKSSSGTSATLLRRAFAALTDDNPTAIVSVSVSGAKVSTACLSPSSRTSAKGSEKTGGEKDILVGHPPLRAAHPGDLIGRRRPQFTHVDLLLGDRVHQVDDHLPRPLARKGIAVHARTGRRRKLHPDIFTG